MSEETSNLTPGSPKKYAYKEILAHYVWEAVVFGKFKFRDGRMVIFDNGKDWLDLVKWLYERIDGAPKQPIAMDKIEIVVRYDEANNS